MGMYTQVRGWLNIDSIGYGEDRLIKAEKLLEQFKEELVCDFEDNQLFSTKEVCQKYCDELNKYEKYKHR